MVKQHLIAQIWQFLFLSQGWINPREISGMENISNRVKFIIHMIEYHYWCLPHAHMVFRLDNAHDIDANDQNNLIDFVDRNFIAELPWFEGEEFENIHWWDNKHELTEDYKAKALEMDCKHNLHKSAVAVNGCKQDISDRCRRGYSRMETINNQWNLCGWLNW
jgi:hypothetical protein